MDQLSFTAWKHPQCRPVMGNCHGAGPVFVVPDALPYGDINFYIKVFFNNVKYFLQLSLIFRVDLHPVAVILRNLDTPARLKIAAISAIWQCLAGESRLESSSLYLRRKLTYPATSQYHGAQSSVRVPQARLNVGTQRIRHSDRAVFPAGTANGRRVGFPSCT